MAVCSILYQLATRPEEQEKIYRELVTVFPDPNEKLTASKLEQLPYLRAFIKEVFRYEESVSRKFRSSGRSTKCLMNFDSYEIEQLILDCQQDVFDSHW